MKHSIWTRAASTLIAAAALLAAACGGSDSMGAATSPSTLKLANVGSVGNYLADGNGRALYYFALDLPAGGGNPAVSNCSGMCVSYWPIFHTASVVVQGIDMKDVGQMTRADGSQQTTYKGWPLYYYVGDTGPSDITGDASTGGGPTPVWFLLRSPFYTVLTLTDGATGATRLADAAGNSLYTFNLDTVGSPPTSACAGTPGDRNTCVGNWPIYLTETAVTPTGLDPRRFTVFTRASDGKRQSAFDGNPLYYFVDDTVPGDVKGLTFPPGLGHWFNVDPAQQ